MVENAMNRILDAFRARRFYGTAELAEEAASILQRVGARQERGHVTDFPDERTVRYYLSEALIPAPDEKSGLKSVFGFRHLLTLLVIKQLQSQHIPIRKIREIVADRPDAELEMLLGPEFGETRSEPNEARSFLESLLVRHKPEARKSPMPMSIDLGHASRQRGNRWQRFEPLPGLEINIAENFRLPSDPAILEDVIDELRRLLIRRH